MRSILGQEAANAAKEAAAAAAAPATSKRGRRSAASRKSPKEESNKENREVLIIFISNCHPSDSSVKSHQMFHTVNSSNARSSELGDPESANNVGN